MRNKNDTYFSSLFPLLMRGRSSFLSFASLSKLEKQRMHEVASHCLKISSLAPSQCNLQPTRYYHCYDATQIKTLFHSIPYAHTSDCIASGVILVLSDKEALFAFANAILEEDRAKGAISEREFRLFSRLLDMSFLKRSHLFRACFRSLLFPILRFFFSVPEIPQVDSRSWLYKQAGIFAGTLFLELSAHNIDWKIIEGFNEKKILSLFSYSASQYSIPFLIAYGKAKEQLNGQKTALEISLS